MPLTLVTTCKPFRGAAVVAQGNALGSWSRLRPGCEVLVCGEAAGTREVCDRHGFRHIADVATNEFGTPLLSGLLAASEHHATSDLIGLVNADIMLTGSLLQALERVRERFARFLLVVRRWNVTLDEAWSFDTSDWEARLTAFAHERGSLEPVWGGIDLFVFPKGLYTDVPPFAIGRGRWDSFLIAAARRQRVPVVDATASCLTVHPEHEYAHVAGQPAESGGGGKPAYESTPEGRRNVELLGGAEFVFSCANATHVLGVDGVRRYLDLAPAHLLRRAAVLPALHPALRPLRPLVRAGLPVWRGLRTFAEERRRQRKRRGLPYPISVEARHRHTGPAAVGDGVETFDSDDARAINRARLDHLASLELDWTGRSVLDVGCGVGHLAQFFAERGCHMLCIDARKENVERLRELYPALTAEVVDIEREGIRHLGRFDVVFSYGLLYHLENPFAALRKLAEAAREVLLLETQVVDHEAPVVRMDEETGSVSQALWGIGCRPSPSYVVLALREAGMPNVYAPRTPPAHPDFRFRWRGDLSLARRGHSLRAIFVGSRVTLANPRLVPLLERTS